MFPKMRRSEKELPKERALHLLDEGVYGVLCLPGPEGHPYGVPLNFARVGEDLYFHGSKKGQKVEILQGRPRASLTVVTKCVLRPKDFDTDYASVVVFGEGRIVEEEGEKRRALEALVRKYSPDFYDEGMAYIERRIKAVEIFALSMDHVTAKQGR